MVATPANDLNIKQSGLVKFDGTATFTGVTTTQYDVLVGAASNGISNVGPGTAGQVLQSGGNAANPAYSTATYPSTAGNTGNVLTSDGTNWISTAPINGISANLGISYSAGTFTVNDALGNALSATNPGYITLPSRATPGQSKTFKITANQSFTDVVGSNQLGNSLFGLTSNVAFAQDIPFYIYFGADNADANGTFFISRVPHRTVCPAAGNIGQSGNTLASTQGSFFAMQAVTAANFAGISCICIGAFRMRYASAASPWTVQTLTDGSTTTGINQQADGIGCFHEGTKFVVATGHFGNAAGSFFLNNGGTAPVWSTQGQSYQILKSGAVTVETAGVTNSAGSGAVTAFMGLVFVNWNSTGTMGTLGFTGSFGIFQSQANATNVALVGQTGASTALFSNAQVSQSSFNSQMTYTADPQ